MQHYSQLKQDIFAFITASNKTYIEIGASHPIKINNSYLLEQNGWPGFSIELDTSKKEFWEDSDRANKIYWSNAITFDYLNAIKENSLPNRIGYLSVDIEPPKNTFAALQNIIETGTIFDCITFEHDNYQNNDGYDVIVKDYLLSRGYKIAVDNVYRTRKFRVPNLKKKQLKKCYIETWFVYNDIDFISCDYDLWTNQN